MIGRITDDVVLEVQQAVTRIKNIGYHQRKKAAFAQTVPELSAPAHWLLTFSCWFCLFNGRFTAVDPSLYWALPPGAGRRASFVEFLRVVQHYDRLRVTTRREAELSEFLSRCSAEYRTFYLSLLAKTLVKGLPLTDLQLLLPIDTIDPEELYGPLPVLTTSFADLTYPVLIQPIDGASLDALRFTVYHRKSYHYIGETGPERTRFKVSRAHRRDLRVLPLPRITLPGLQDKSGRFYAVDAFDTDMVYKRWRDTGQGKAFPERVSRLGTLRQVITTELSNAPFALVRNEQGIREGLNTALTGGHSTHLLISDGQSALEGVAHTVECRISEGRAEGLWLEEGQVKGLLVWCNGVIHRCPYTFTGPENSLLNTPELVAGKQVAFYYFDFAGTVHLLGREILWDAKGWRPNRLKGVGIHIEKCALCGSRRWPHQNKGLCTGCIRRILTYYFEKHGPDVWIKPSVKMQAHRHTGCWNYSLLNNCHYRHAGRYILEARENGDWRFVDEHAKELSK